MKKYIFFLSMILAFQVHAQYPIVFDGYVYDSSGAGIANKTIDVSVLIGPSYVGFTQLTTNTNGNFDASFNISDSAASFKFLVFDCFGDSVIWTEFWSSNQGDTLSTSVSICRNSNCTGRLDINQYQPLSINVSVTDSFFASYTYDWDMGDGTVFNNSPNSSFNYTYSIPGVYQVCVTANSTNCTYSICDSITLLPPPDSITVYGFVEDTSGNRISNAGISIKNDSTSPWSYVSGTATDSSGDYSLKVADNAFPNGYVIVQFNDCNYSSTFDSIVSIHPLVPTGDSIESNFDQYCANVNCGGNLFSSVNFTTANFNLNHNVNNLGYSYTWDFGDGSGPLSGGKIISHQYNTTGTFNVCVTATSQYCTYTICDSIQINTLPPSANFTVYGQVLDSSGNAVSNHQVFFYQDSSSLIWQQFQSTFTDSFGFYSQVLPVDSFGSYIIISMYSPCPDSLTSTESTVPAGDSIESNFQFCQGSQPSCSGSISASVNGLQANFIAVNNISAAYTYSWDFGDGTIISGAQNSSHTYSASGIYLVCVTATSTGCTYTICDSVTVQGGNTCALFFDYQNFGSSISFSGFDSLSTPLNSYSWNFGDGNTANGLNSINIFQTPGVYNVCLQKIDSTNSCTYCDSVLVSFDTSGLSISGNININSTGRSGDLIILYEETNTGSSPFIQAHDSTINANGNYIFHGLSPAAYTVRVLPVNISADPGLIPQYWQQENYWGDASSIMLNSNQQGIDFNFNFNPNSLSGPGAVVVSIKDTLNQNLENAIIWIEDLNENIIQYDISDLNSNILFDNLPYGDYKIGTDYPGYYMFKEDVSLNSNFPTDSIGLALRNGWVATSLKESNTENELSIFPNPTEQVFYIKHKLDIIEMKVKNIEGKEVGIKRTDVNGKCRIEYIEKPSKGIYLIQIISEEKMISKKLFVR